MTTHVGRLQAAEGGAAGVLKMTCCCPYLHGSYIDIEISIYIYILYIICTYMSIDLFDCELCIYRYIISYKNSINHRSFGSIEQKTGSPVANIR